MSHLGLGFEEVEPAPVPVSHFSEHSPPHLPSKGAIPTFPDIDPAPHYQEPNRTVAPLVPPLRWVPEERELFRAGQSYLLLAQSDF